jgi:parvulin-like peptidyl-prolyl isomerase
MASSLRKHLPLLLLALVTALGAAACGSGSGPKAVPPGAIAIVGDKPIPKTDFDQLLTQAQKNFEAQNQEFPKVGTPEYENVKNTIVQGLVQQAEWEQEGETMGIKVSDQEVQKQLDALKQQFFQGDEDKYKAELEKAGLTDKQVRQQLRAKLLSDKIQKAVLGKVKVTDAAIQTYYTNHKSDYKQPESRDVRHILVKTKALADKLYNQIKGGADFAKLARKYSQDTASKAAGGNFTAYQGKTVAPFDKFVFDAQKGDLSKPIKTEFGWHIIEILSDVKPASTTPLKDVKETIRSTLLQQRQKAALTQWTKDVKEKYKDEVAYAPGFAPAPAQTGTTTG